MSKKQNVLARYLGESPKSLVPSKWDASVFEVRPYTEYDRPSPEQAIYKATELKAKLVEHFGNDPALASVQTMLDFGSSKRFEVAWQKTEQHPRFIVQATTDLEVKRNQELYHHLLDSYDCRGYVVAYNILRVALSITDDQNLLFHLLSGEDHWHNYVYRQAYDGLPIDETKRGSHPANHGEYMVLTEREANKRASNYILDSLWAFNPGFLATYLRGNLESEMIKGIQEACENANPTLLALLKNKKRLVADAIRADGRGHFLNTYDGEEHEFEGYYIYRMN